MKIAFLHSSNDVYGASGVLSKDAIRLAAQGHEVSVVVPAEGPLVALREFIGDGYVVDPHMAVIRRINPRDAARPPVLPVAARSADVVVLWTTPMALYAPMLRARHRPHVVSVHERDDSVAGRALLSLALGRRTPTQVVSEWVREWVSRQVDADRIVRSFPFDSWSAGPPRDQKALGQESIFSAERPMQLLLVGRVSGRKGHVLATRVVQELHRRGRHVHLTLAGAPYPGQERHLDELLASMEHCNDIVTYVGEVPSMRSVAEGKDIVLVFPIKPEPFGISALEAWQCGLPVLGIPAGGAAESLALIDGMRTGSDVLMIADDLTRLYDDPRGRWRHRPDWVPAQVLCGEQDRTDCWMRLLEMAVA